MSDVLALFANFPSVGEEFTKIEGRSVRNLIRLNLDGFEIEIHQDHNIVIEGISKLRGCWIHTSNVLVKKVPKARLPFVKTLLGDLADILAFESGSPVHFFGYEFPAESGLWHRWNSFGELDPSWSIAEHLLETSVSGFVEGVWPRYRALKKERRLRTVIEYLVQADKSDQFLELRLVIGFLILENLKDTYVRVAGIPFYKGYFRRIKTGRTSLSEAPRYSFEALLTEMLKEQRTRRGIKRIVKLRNELIHSGVSRLPYRSARKIYIDMMQLIREYLLRLLRYKGAYISYGGTVRKV